MSESSLRMRVVEAGARAQHASWCDCGERVCDEFGDETVLSVEIEAVLDGMLDCLTENADEWAKRADGWIDDSVAKDLLGVLRNPQ